MGTKHLAKTRFLLHAGLAIGAFRHFVYVPFKAGKFKSGAPGRIKAMAVAVAASFKGSATKLGAPITETVPPSVGAS